MIRGRSPSLRSIAGLSGSIFFMPLATAPFLAIYLKDYLQWSYDQIGIVLGAMELTIAVCQIPAGLLIDSVKIKRLLLFFAALFTTIGTLFILERTMPFVLASQVLIGVSIAIIPPAFAAVTLGLVGKPLFPKRISLNETFDHMGNVAIAVIMGILSHQLGYYWILYMIVLFYCASVFFLLLINPKEIDHKVARALYNDKNGGSRQPIAIASLLKKSFLPLFCLSVFFFHLSNAAQLPLVGQFLAQQHKPLDTVFIAACIILAQIVMAAVSYSMGFFMNIFGRKPLFLAAFAVLALRAALYTVTDKPGWLLLVQSLDGIGYGIYSVIGVVIISDIVEKTGRFNFSIGLMAFSHRIGASVSFLLIGWIVERWGFHTGFITLSAIALAGFLLFSFFVPETKKQIA